MKSKIFRGQLRDLIQVVTQVRTQDEQGGYEHDYQIDYELYARIEDKVQFTTVRDKPAQIEVTEFVTLYNEELYRSHEGRKVKYNDALYSIRSVAPVGNPRMKRFMVISTEYERAEEIA